MMDARECTDRLLDESCPLDERARLFADYLAWHSTLRSRMGLGARYGRVVAVQRLFEQTPFPKQVQLKAVLDEIQKYYRQQRDLHRAQGAAAGRQLRSIAPGTLVELKLPQFREPVAFVEMKRTRFVIEDKNGSRFAVPARALVRVLDNQRVGLMTDSERRKRELVRALAGRAFAYAREEILASGIEMLHPLVAELEAARLRVAHAPVGMTKGLFMSLGPCRIVSPFDQALLKRIPQVLGEVMQMVGVDRVRDVMRRWKNAATVQLMEAELKRLDREQAAKRTRSVSARPSTGSA